MLVSAIIPTYNRSKTLERAINSALAQTWNPMEIIVVDDGSTDGTPEILAPYGDKIRVIRQINQGASSARNTGIRAAKGEILAFLDSDDTWQPTKIERQVKLLQETYHAGVRCCICNIQMIYPGGRSTTSFALADLSPAQPEGIWNNPAEILVTRFLLFNQAAAIWRETLHEIGLFREDLKVLEDYELSLRLSLLGPWAFVAEPLVTWYGGEENSLTKSVSEYKACWQIREILSGLKNSSRWGGFLPKALLQDRLCYLQRCIAVYDPASNRAILSGPRKMLMKYFLRIQKAVNHRRSSFPKMITTSIRSS